jgi:hypothetical protein
MQWILAAGLVILGGVAIAPAEEVTLKVEVADVDHQEVTISIDGNVEVVRVEDLAEGEERVFDVGGHTLVVRRVNDRLELSHDGEEFPHRFHAVHGMADAVWVSGDEDCMLEVMGDGEAAVRKRVVVKHVDGDSDGEAEAHAYHMGHGDHTVIDIDELKERIEAGDLEGLEELDIDVIGDDHVFISKAEEGHHRHPIVVKTGGTACGDYVRYRCEETGSELRVKKDEGLLESYIDPVTGCMMERVEESMTYDVRIIKRLEKVEE